MALVSAWCFYHLFEYCGTVALWSWTGDLVPRPIRGRFCGYRERWLVSGRIAGIAFTDRTRVEWDLIAPGSPRVQPLAVSAACGAVFMLLAVVPLVFMPGVEYLPSAVPRTPWRTVVRAMSQRPYRQLVLFSWRSRSSMASRRPRKERIAPRILESPYQGLQTIVATMRVGQMVIAPTMGRWCDAFGSRPVMILSQLVVATGPLFLFLATRGQWWWIVATYVVWIAYAGLNVGLDNIKLKLAPDDNNVALPRGLLLGERHGLRPVDPARRLDIRPARGSWVRHALHLCRHVSGRMGWAHARGGAAGADRRTGGMARTATSWHGLASLKA